MAGKKPLYYCDPLEVWAEELEERLKAEFEKRRSSYPGPNKSRPTTNPGLLKEIRKEDGRKPDAWKKWKKDAERGLKRYATGIRKKHLCSPWEEFKRKREDYLARAHYLCDDTLEKYMTTVITHVINYVRGYKEVARHVILKQEPVRPLSIVLFGPPGAGKSSFAKTVCECLNVILDSDCFVPLEANLAEYERIESLGQLLVRLRNKKIDSDYPPVLFVDEADASSDTFVRLLTMLWDGKFYWDVQERLLGAMIIFLAGSTIRCKKQFEWMTDPTDYNEYVNQLQEIEKYEGAKKKQEECDCKSKQTVHAYACPYITQLRTRGENGQRGDSPNLWNVKGSDFLSRVNGPILFVPDLTQEPDYKKQLFTEIVKAHLRKLGHDVNIDVDPPPETPRYGTRSLNILAESLDVRKLSGIKSRTRLGRTHFAFWPPNNQKDSDAAAVYKLHFPSVREIAPKVRKRTKRKGKTPPRRTTARRGKQK